VLLRRMLTFLALLLVVTALAAGLAPPPRPLPPQAGVTAPGTAPPGSSVIVARTLDASRTRPRTITVRSGDILSLTVRSDTADAVELQNLGALRAVAPDAPVTFDVLPDEPGEYPVVLVGAGRTVGTVRVVSQPR
jgi:hypothetical protein